MTQLNLPIAPVAPLVESGVPIPIHARREKSAERKAAEALLPGQCVTLIAKDEKEQRTLSRRLNALRTTILAEMPERGYTVRTMWGEIDNDIKPVVRLWRTT